MRTAGYGDWQRVPAGGEESPAPDEPAAARAVRRRRANVASCVRSRLETRWRRAPSRPSA
eukprot:scaffold1399_cov410-Prasinococcus_capsulatus_cf.AAC.21